MKLAIRVELIQSNDYGVTSYKVTSQTLEVTGVEKDGKLRVEGEGHPHPMLLDLTGKVLYVEVEPLAGFTTTHSISLSKIITYNVFDVKMLD